MNITSKVLEEIRSEILRQNKKWGQQNHKGIEWMAILMEEIGEASKEILDFHFKYPNKDSLADIDEVQAKRISNYRKELIQIAAVTVQMIESVDRNHA